MRTIAFVTQKGGSGKSTLASSLAVAAHDSKERVCVVDMDPQGSLISWAKKRGVDDIAVVAAGAARLPAALALLRGKGFTLAIIDTPGAEGPASAAAMIAADLNIIPSRPSLFDLARFVLFSGVTLLAAWVAAFGRVAYTVIMLVVAAALIYAVLDLVDYEIVKRKRQG